MFKGVDLTSEEASRYGFVWKDNEDSITLLKYVGSQHILILPSSIDKKPCTTINANAIQDYVSSLLVPNSYHNITNVSFVSPNLKEVILLSHANKLNIKTYSKINAEVKPNYKVTGQLLSHSELKSLGVNLSIVFRKDIEKFSKVLYKDSELLGVSWTNEELSESGFSINDDLTEHLSISDSYKVEKCIKLPQRINGRNVIRVKEKALSSIGIEELEIPFGYTQIDYLAFHCNNLKLVKLPVSLIYCNVHSFRKQMSDSFTLEIPECNKKYFEEFECDKKFYKSPSLSDLLKEFFTNEGKDFMLENKFISLGMIRGLDLYTTFESISKIDSGDMKQFCFIKDEGAYRELRKDSYVSEKLIINNLIAYLIPTDNRVLELNRYMENANTKSSNILSGSELFI